MALPSGVNKNDLRILDPKKVQVTKSKYGRLQLQVGIEERYDPVRAVRALPMTQPDKFISFQDDDNEEIGIIPSLGDLDAASRQAVEEDLELYYLKARVTAIKGVENRNGILTWEVETDLGRKTVHVRDRQHIRMLPGGATMLTDIHEAKFQIPPMDQLDEESRKWLETET